MDSTRIKAIEFMQKHIDSIYHDSTKKLINSIQANIDSIHIDSVKLETISVTGNTIRYYSHVNITFFSILILLNIWIIYYEKRLDQKEIRRDTGLMYLMLALFTWCIINVFRAIFPELIASNQLSVVEYFLSSTNNAFFLISILYFEHGIQWFKKEDRLPISQKFIWLLSAIILLLEFILFFCNKIELGNGVDLAYSCMTLLCIMGVLFLSFFNRKLILVAFISLAAVSFVLIGQIIIYFDRNHQNPDAIIKTVTFISSYSIFSTLFIALGFSWVIEIFKSFIKEQSALAKFNIEIRVNKFWENYSHDQLILKEKLSENVRENDFDIVLGILNKFWSKKLKDDPENVNIKEKLRDISHLSSRWSHLSIEKSKGVIDDASANIEHKKISLNLLEYTDEL